MFSKYIFALSVDYVYTADVHLLQSHNTVADLMT
jgi:hypothetical protein